jgi:hypothetical protein
MYVGSQRYREVPCEPWLPDNLVRKLHLTEWITSLDTVKVGAELARHSNDSNLKIKFLVSIVVAGGSPMSIDYLTHGVHLPESSVSDPVDVHKMLPSRGPS